MYQAATVSLRAVVTTATFPFFLAAILLEEHAERPRMGRQVLGGLDQEPAGLAVTALGDGPVIAPVAGLTRGWDEPE
jgi:hypothetical protein